jgi:hypothetical protein
VTPEHTKIAHMNMTPNTKPYLVVDKLWVLGVQDHIDVAMPVLAYSLSVSRHTTGWRTSRPNTLRFRSVHDAPIRHQLLPSLDLTRTEQGMRELQAYGLDILFWHFENKKRPALCDQIAHQRDAGHTLAGARHTCKQRQHQPASACWPNTMILRLAQ